MEKVMNVIFSGLLEPESTWVNCQKLQFRGGIASCRFDLNVRDHRYSGLGLQLGASS
jgi:hypothetical protein